MTEYIGAKIDEYFAVYEENILSKRKKGASTSGPRGAYKYQKKKPSYRMEARKLQAQQIAENEKAIAEGKEPPNIVINKYDSFIPCEKCKSRERYISSGTCVVCRSYKPKEVTDPEGYGWRKLAMKEARFERTLALAANAKHYEGAPCKRCGGKTYYTTSMGCVQCIKDRANARREKEASRFAHPTSKIMFVKREPSLPDVYALCPNLAAYPGCTLIYTDKVKPKRWMGEDVMLNPYLLHKIVGATSQKLQMGLQLTEEEQLVVQYISSAAMDLACKIYNRAKSLKGKQS